MKNFLLFILLMIIVNINYGQGLIDIFNIEQSTSRSVSEKDLIRTELTTSLKDFSILRVNNPDLNYKALKNLKDNAILMKLPLDKSQDIYLELTNHNIYSENFRIIEKSKNGEKVVKYSKPSHFIGTVRGHKNSLVGITVAEDQLTGVISLEGKNYNLQLYQHNLATDTYILFDQSDYTHPLEFSCGIKDQINSTDNGAINLENTSSQTSSTPINLYLECDYNMYLKNGRSTSATVSYATSLFNVIANIYSSSAGVDLRLSELVVWRNKDPYEISSTTSGHDVLNSFGSYNQNYNGQIAHLLTTSPVSDVGGVANFGNCNNPNKGLYGLSASLTNAFTSNLSIYSWDIYVMAHEIGHNFSSPHTHACAWNGNNTPIDCCGYSAAQNCSCTVNIPNKGTIMSYCSPEIDLSKGFHPQVARKVREFANCLGSDFAMHNLSTRVKDGHGGIAVDANNTVKGCSDNCTFSYPNNSRILMRADPANDNDFVRWEGGSCHGSTSRYCNFYLTENTSITAIFRAIDQSTKRLTMQTEGEGSISVEYNNNITFCPSTCTYNYPHQSNIIITAFPDEGQRFVRWSGGPCDNLNNPKCSFPITNNLNITAIFEPLTFSCSTNYFVDILQQDWFGDLLYSRYCEKHLHFDLISDGISTLLRVSVTNGNYDYWTCDGTLLASCPQNTSCSPIHIKKNVSSSKPGRGLYGAPCGNIDTSSDNSTNRIGISTNLNLTHNELSKNDIKISPNYPNPFTYYTTIPVELSEASLLEINVISLSGQMIFNEEYELDAGEHSLKLDGALFPNSGIYFYTIRMKGKNIQGKLTRL